MRTQEDYAIRLERVVGWLAARHRPRRQLAERNPQLVGQMTHHLRGGHAPPPGPGIGAQCADPVLKHGADVGFKH
jgi:hypothetical protein